MRPAASSCCTACGCPACRCSGWRARLREAGFAPEIFGYPRVAGGPEAAIPRLAERLRDAPAHVLAHSLGGLVALQALQRTPGPAGAARRLPGLAAVRQRRGRRAGRHAWTAADAGPQRRPAAAGLRRLVRATAEVGMVAGSVPHGLGALFRPLRGRQRRHRGGRRNPPAGPGRPRRDRRPATAACCSRPRRRGRRSAFLRDGRFEPTPAAAADGRCRPDRVKSPPSPKRQSGRFHG